MLNDYYALSLFDPDREGSIDELRLTLKIYASVRVSRIHLALKYDPGITVRSHLVHAKCYYSKIRAAIPKNLNLILVHTVPLLRGISKLADLDELSINVGEKRYIYISFPLGINVDDAVSELHYLIHKRHLTPILTSYEKLGYYLDPMLIRSLELIPNAVYQIGLSNICSLETKALIKHLLKLKKTVIFGSADKFDACLYNNINYYLKHIHSSVGLKRSAYFIITHNKLFC